MTGYAESTTNRGRTGVAGMMTGACLVRQVIEIPQSGRVLQLGVAMTRWQAMFAARQSQLVRMFTGGAGHKATRKQ